MAPKHVLRTIKIELTAGNAGPAEVGKMLGPYGLNLRDIIVRYNEATAGQRGDLVPVQLTIYEDRSYDLRILTPPTSFLLRRAAGLDRGSARPAAGGADGTGVVTAVQLREIAVRKLPDLNTDDVTAAMRVIAGTARSMGIRIES
jgi:large subunit ribosomal protein L11